MSQEQQENKRVEEINLIYNTYLEKIKDPAYLYVKEAVELIKSVVNHQNLPSFYVSYNGGKDATLVLFFFYFALKDLNLSERIDSLYFEQSNSIETVDLFMHRIEKLLRVNTYRLPSKKYAWELTMFVQQHGLTHVVMGSRVTDPYCQGLQSIAPSDQDKGYPPFLRVNPIVKWSYEQVWECILQFKIPYCALYEQGYTRLGNTVNTVPNPDLYDPVTNTFLPAHKALSASQHKSRK